ncbi:hypothetical protein QBC39DRAFT_426744 [Podospora conica]|nr:hypothetical protein QBC39DRAFT_426744 [Schizothecium conicum]
MDPQSPPKRMTRARAAAKGTEPAAKPTTVIAAAARSRAMRGTASTSAKRKARSDDVDDSDNDEPEPTVVKAPVAAAAAAKPKAARGRPKKTPDTVPQPAPEEQPAVAAAKPRGRPKKVVVEPPVEEPVKTTTRATRAKKVAVEPAEPAEPPKKTTRGRPPSTIASKTAVVKPTVKKSVTFDEPEKENLAPAGASTTRAPAKAAAPTTGLKAKPLRRPAATTAAPATRTARGAKTVAAGEKPTPLSPKKVNQLTSTHADSDDELAPSGRLAAKPLRKNPIRPPGKKAAPDVQVTSTAEENATDSSEALPRSLLASPPKKMPQSPFKNCMKSPAKRVEGVLPPATAHATEGGESSQSAFKASLLQSPAKRPPGGMLKAFEFGGMTPGQGGPSPFKTSLLLSPAKRAFSPMKPLVLPAVEDEQPARSPAPKPTLLATPLPSEEKDAEEEDSMVLDGADEADVPESPTRLRFPGRMSAVLPRHADPALTSDLVDVAETAEEDVQTAEEPTPVETQDEQAEGAGDPMAVDSDNEHEDDIDDDATEPDDDADTSPQVSPAKSAGPMFRLRKEDLEDYDSETDGGSEDELAPRRKLFPTTGTATPLQTGFFKAPTSRSAADATPTGRSTAKRARTDAKFGFTPLAEQLSGWAAGPSPLKLGNYVVESPSITVSAPPAPTGLTPAPEGFFDEAMARQSDDMAIDTEVEVAAVPDAETPELEDVAFTEEDVALAAEAREMSLMEQEKVDDHVGNHSFDDSISEASQEYGDENEIPIDPRLAGEPGVPLTTPRRTLNREFHTVSKVPLKPADDSSPVLKVKKQRHSISRLPVSRPTHTLTRNATVISYSPTKSKDDDLFEDDERDERAGSAPPATPTKSEAGWSLVGTPARTPRRDVDPALLRGAIVFVDVHTSEGADASGIFVELLTQMGARCVKTWSWNPSNDPAQEGSSSKIGITHVVYKDGGKRTLEKVRESGGVVQCVGVSWVLDCERENQWLEEGPYYIDTKVVPRGGARRRKSMEPRAIANMNGMLVPTPTRHSLGSRGSQTAPTTPVNGRRQSALWIRTPEGADDQVSDEEEDDDDTEWRAALAPVPKTPAPEAIARYVANLSPATPSDSTMYTNDMEDDEEDDDARRAAMLTRTCPPKPAGPVIAGLGHGILSQNKDERVLMRLMAARRKSLQFAPKIGSPLARTWN